MSYKILHSEKGPIIQLEDGEVFFVEQFGHLAELYDQYENVLTDIKDFLSAKLREFLETEILSMYEMTPTNPSFAQYLNTIGKMREFEFAVLPGIKELENPQFQEGSNIINNEE